MNDEAQKWLHYARENRAMADLAFDAGFFNPCLHNAQQAVEKALKALRQMAGLVPRRTHSIRDLRADLTRVGIDVGLDIEDCELLDSIYLPSKYPLGSALPDFDPDALISRRCLEMADRVLSVAEAKVDPG